MIISEKIPGGKLVILEIEFQNNIIKEIKITGDFFLHPEETMEKVENALKESPINEIAKRIIDVLTRNQAQFIGVSAEDIEQLASKAII